MCVRWLLAAGCDGYLRAVDYGNYEYLAVLEFWSLLEPKIGESLNSMRDAWPTLLDLWNAAQTVRCARGVVPARAAIQCSIGD